MISKKSRSAPQDRRKIAGDHFIIAIGASAGGLEAIHTFFDSMPEGGNCSFVIIQHLSPDYKSLLVELVGRHTDMQVHEAEHETEIQKNCIYVIPNNKFITVKKGKLVLADKPPAKAPNNAVDVFLFSLAEYKKEQAIAIILSGTGTDGTKGAEAIKRAGGLVIAQDPLTAKFDGMPNSVISSGNVDVVLSPSEIPAELLSHLQEPSLFENQANITDDSLEEIFDLIHAENGFDFHYYKTPTLLRRITRRMVHHKMRSASEYVDLLRRDPDECRQLGKDFLIGVTRFFRDQEAFEILRTTVIPAIVDSKNEGEIIQVWVSACSTGEEAYSIAIALDQVLQEKQKRVDVKIFATDLDSVHIEIASRGLYTRDIQKDVSHEILGKYFTETESGYAISQRIRKQIVFAKHNIIKDPPFIKKDLVTCRNMLIYMNPVLQQKVYAILLFATRLNGYIFLGSSEHPNAIRNNVVDVSAKWKIYKKTVDGKSMHFSIVTPERKTISPGIIAPVFPDDALKKQKGLWEGFEEILSDDLNCTALYIDHNFEIRRAIGNHAKILSLPNKDFKFQLLKMVPTEVSSLLSAEIKRSWKNGQKLHLKSVRYKKDDHDQFFNIIIKPPVTSYLDGYTLVTLIEVQTETKVKNAVKPQLSPNIQRDDYISALQEELQETRYNLQLALEDQETTNEELQSSNEELLSANEELQSSNEELQSVNEELHTLNTEHQVKIRELLELNDDLNNYFRSIDIGQIYLDKNLHIRKFNPASARMINFIDSDIGRPFTHISNNILHDKLIEDVNMVLKTNRVVEKEVQLVNEKNFLMRIMPYLTRDNQTGGVIISFVDITVITRLNNIIRGVFNASQSAILAFEAVRDADHKIVDFRVQTANDSANTMFSVTVNDLREKSLKKDLPFLGSKGMFERYVAVVEKNRPLHDDIFLEDGEKWLEASVVKMMDGVVATFADITAKKNSEQRLKKNYIELTSVKENLKTLNKDLETKVSERTRELSDSEERFRLVARATNDALWDWDFVNNTVWWGESFFTMFGFSSGKPFSRNAWLSQVHPDDREAVQKSLDDVINSHEKQWEQEYRFEKGDGTYAVIFDRGYILHDENGMPYRMLGSMFDLTRQKLADQEIAQSNSQRKFLAESMPFIVWTSDAYDSVNFVNQKFETYTGLTERDSLDKGWKSAIHPEDLPQLLDTWKHAEEHQEDFQLEIRIRLASGQYHWNLLTARARRDQSGALLNWVITTIDIHEQRNHNDILERKVQDRTSQLQATNQALERSNYDLQQFASVASHDLQEPLRKIHMFAHLVRDKYVSDNPEAQPFLEKILQSSQRMKAMIASVLNFSKLAADEDHFENTDLTKLVHDLTDDFEMIIKEKKAEVIIDVLPTAQVIPAQMRQVFQNLLSNAIKFSKPDVPPKIKIKSERIAERSFSSASASEGAYIKVTVTDNGIGFEKEYSDSIFDLFQRLHSKDKYEGTGIGLAITKKIIEKHFGLIRASSIQGQGATFEFIIPIQHKLI